MKVLLLEPYMTDSHQSWAEGLRQHSPHEIHIISLPGVQWKWRMHGAAVYFANLLKDRMPPDLLIVSDMMDLATFRGLLPAGWAEVPAVLYFHENQLTYPWSANDPDPDTGRDLHYAWIHLTGCLSANEVWFNSAYHRKSFLAASDKFISRLPAPLPKDLIETIRSKSKVMPIGISEACAVWETDRSISNEHVILWNHRWEYDKGPEQFFEVLYQIQNAGIPFQVVILGNGKGETEEVFSRAKQRLANHILHWGYTDSKDQYFQWLKKSTILPVTSRHDFFGLSVLEAVASGVQPLLPQRLSYPELYGSHPDSFYQNEEELVAKLIKLLTQPWKENLSLRQVANQYTWKEVIKQYNVSISQMM